VEGAIFVLSLSGIDWEEVVSRPVPSQHTTQGRSSRRTGVPDDQSVLSNVTVVAEYKGFGPWRVSRQTRPGGAHRESYLMPCDHLIPSVRECFAALFERLTCSRACS
jgi:hypothetical protein